MLTIKQARAELKLLDITIKRNKFGEYRVNFVGGREETAYYTNDLHDAVATGKAMAEQKKYS
jgi:glutamine amidotransferase PdxT